MRIAFGVLLAVHGLIHALGFAKAFGARSLPLGAHISRPQGLLWFTCLLLFWAGAALLFAGSEAWWLPLLPALLLSQGMVFSAFSDAKFGSLANALILLPVLFALLERRPASFRSSYRREVAHRLTAARARQPFTESELATLPSLFRTYLERVGALRYGHVGSVRVALRGEIRRSTEAGWMHFEAEQHDFFEQPARLFYLRSSLYGVPFDALHVYAEHATMQARVASLFQVVDAKGQQMDQSETVTLFNDMCVMAPGALVGAHVSWEQLGPHSLRGTFDNAGHSVSAVLSFDDSGVLSNFVSDDRYLSADGKSYAKYRWSTPLSGYRDFGGHRAASLGEASWALPSGEFEYARMELLEVEYDPARDLQKGSSL